MLTLLVDSVVSIITGAGITFVVFARYHTTVINNMRIEKRKSDVSSFSDGWDDAVKYVMTEATDEEKKVLRQKFKE